MVHAPDPSGLAPSSPSPLRPVVRSTRAGRLRSRLDRLLRHPATDVTVMVLIVVSIVLLLVETYGQVGGAVLTSIVWADSAITIAFIVELSCRWFTAPSTSRHFREYWIDWLAVLPALRPLRVLRVLRILRFLRLLRLYRFGLMVQRFVARTDHHRFEEMLRSELAHYRGRFADQIWLVPDLLRMLTNLLEDGRVNASSRQKITAAIAYFITPFELLPREVHGAEGYLDQAYLCLRVTRDLRDELPDYVLEEAWEGECEILQIIDEELPLLERQIGAEGVEQLERYLGLGAAALPKPAVAASEA